MAKSKKAEQQAQVDALLADEYLGDLIYRALLDRAEPSKVSEITEEIDNPNVSFPAVRRIVADSARFLTIDRMWDLSARYLDQSRPTERNLIEVLKAAGVPLTLREMATELSIVYERGPSAYQNLLPRVLQNRSAYVPIAGTRYGLTAWLPLVDAEEEEDILSDNDLTPDRLAPYQEAASSVSWTATSYADATAALAAALGDRPLPHRIAGVLAWLALRGKYDPVKHLQACFAAPDKLVWLSGPAGGRWITAGLASRLEADIRERAAALGAITEEADELAAPAAVAAPPVETAAPAAEAAAAETAPVAEIAPAAPPEPEAPPPLDVTEADLAAIEKMVAEREAAVDVSDLLALRYEVAPGDPSYAADRETLLEKLRGDQRFQYVGAGRFREPNALPLFVYSIPEYLHFPDLQFVSRDGEIMDEEIEDEGFAGSLRQDILNPLAQDAGDDEGRYTGPDPEDPNIVRLVVKAHHKDIGTFPLCQVPDGFFPSDAPVVELTIRAPDGTAHDVIVNHEVRLAYSFFGLYELLTVDSGAVFLLHRTARPYEFRFEPVEEPDPQVYVSPERAEELSSLREAAEDGGDMATFDLTCEVLANYPKGLTFVQAMTEINLIRRVTRRKLASILSNYSCFMQKAGTEQWRFDPRKRDLGTDRAKRKYIKR